MTEKETALGRRPGGQGGGRTATGEVASSMDHSTRFQALCQAVRLGLERRLTDDLHKCELALLELEGARP